MSAYQPTHASVAVIVPTYNCGHFIGEAIESILRQSHPPEQIIVVDDGSTDDTKQVIRQFADPRIEYIKQMNAGVSSARNTGLNAVRCDLVTFLDADDRWRPKFVERMHDILVDDQSIVCAFANFVRFEHATGRVFRDQFHYYPELRRPEPNSHAKIPKGMAFSTLVTCGEIPAFTQVMMFRRRLIDSIRFEPNLALCEDSNFALKTFMQGAVAFTDEVLADVRRHDNNATRDYREMVLHKLTALKALAPYVTGNTNLVAYRDRLVKAYIDAALYRTRSGRMNAGLHDYVSGLRVPGSPMRKLKGSVRMALAVLEGLAAIEAKSKLPVLMGTIRRIVRDELTRLRASAGGAKAGSRR
jgi:glycosyltransferase involved in cell wall biosynthesis